MRPCVLYFLVTCKPVISCPHVVILSTEALVSVFRWTEVSLTCCVYLQSPPAAAASQVSFCRNTETRPPRRRGGVGGGEEQPDIQTYKTVRNVKYNLFFILY